MIDFISVDEHDFIALHKIWAKHVDYLVCDTSFKPILAIELNGKSHTKTEIIARDEFVARVYDVIGLPFFTAHVENDFDDDYAEIKKILDKIPGP